MYISCVWLEFYCIHIAVNDSPASHLYIWFFCMPKCYVINTHRTRPNKIKSNQIPWIKATVEIFNSCASRPDVCQCLVVHTPMDNISTSLTQVACEIKATFGCEVIHASMQELNVSTVESIPYWFLFTLSMTKRMKEVISKHTQVKLTSANLKVFALMPA